MPRSRVDGHPWGLVQHDHVLVLIDDVQRSRGGDDPAVPAGVGQTRRQHLPRRRTEVGVHPHPVGQNAVLQPLDPPHYRPGQTHVPFEQSVHLDARQLWGNCQLQPPAHSFLDSQAMGAQRRCLRDFP